MKKKFYKTTFTFSVLTEEPIPPGASLAEILEEADSGSYVAGEDARIQSELTAEQTADELYKMGSEPEFFGIDSDGNAIR